MKVIVLNFMARMLHCQCGSPQKPTASKQRKKSKQDEQESAEVCLRLVNECHINKRSPVAEFRSNKINISNNATHCDHHGNCNPGHEYISRDSDGATDYSTTSLIEGPMSPDVRRLTIMEEILKYLKIMVAKRDEDDLETDIINEWQQVAMVMDRFLFWTFFGCTVITTVVMMVIIPVVRSYTAMEQEEGR